MSEKPAKRESINAALGDLVIPDIPLYDLKGLFIDISAFYKPRGVDNVQGEACPRSRDHHRPKAFRLQK